MIICGEENRQKMNKIAEAIKEFTVVCVKVTEFEKGN